MFADNHNTINRSNDRTYGRVNGWFEFDERKLLVFICIYKEEVPELPSMDLPIIFGWEYVATQYIPLYVSFSEYTRYIFSAPEPNYSQLERLVFLYDTLYG